MNQITFFSKDFSLGKYVSTSCSAEKAKVEANT